MDFLPSKCIAPFGSLLIFLFCYVIVLHWGCPHVPCLWIMRHPFSCIALGLWGHSSLSLTIGWHGWHGNMWGMRLLLCRPEPRRDEWAYCVMPPLNQLGRGASSACPTILLMPPIRNNSSVFVIEIKEALGHLCSLGGYSCLGRGYNSRLRLF